MNNFETALPIRPHDVLTKIVNARDLWVALGVGRDFSTWIKTRLEDCQAEKNTDFAVLDDSPVSGFDTPKSKNPLIEYALTTDLAKEIAMLERNRQALA